MVNFVLCISGYKILVTKIVQKSLSLGIYGGLNSIEKIFKDKAQFTDEHWMQRKKNQIKTKQKEKQKLKINPPWIFQCIAYQKRLKVSSQPNVKWLTKGKKYWLINKF